MNNKIENANLSLERQQEMLDKMKRHAESLGGKLLSSKYNKSSQKFQWQCKYGHKFQQTGARVLHNKLWCPTCKRKEEEKVFKKMAIDKGGEFLRSIEGRSVKILCSCGHEFSMLKSVFINGNWCHKCEKKKREKIIKEYVAKHFNGELLSENVLGDLSRMKYKCKDGHEFYSTFKRIKEGKFCPKCESQKKFNWDEYIRNSLKKKRAKIHNENIIMSTTVVSYTCLKGHKTEKTAKQIKKSKHHCYQCRELEDEKSYYCVDTLILTDKLSGVNWDIPKIA